MNTIFNKRYEPRLSREIMSYIDPVRHLAEKLCTGPELKQYLNETEAPLDLYHIFKLLCQSGDVGFVEEWYEYFNLDINHHSLVDLETYVDSSMIYSYIIYLGRDIEEFRSFEFRGGTIVASPFVYYASAHYNKNILLVLIDNDAEANVFGTFVNQHGTLKRLDPIYTIVLYTLFMLPFDTTVLEELLLKDRLDAPYGEMTEYVTTIADSYDPSLYKIRQSQVNKNKKSVLLLLDKYYNRFLHLYREQMV